jgi:pimeloyl-ACP methyl ester carboxylesterase
MDCAFNARRVTVNGVTLNVIVEGEGPDVLLVHGFPDCHDVWRHQIPALVAAGYRVIAPDMRGAGLSDAPVAIKDYRMTRMASDLAGLLDEMRIDKVRLVGHDHGAVIGFLFCFAYPERVDRYVAMSNGHPAAYLLGPIEQKLKGWYVLLFQIRGFSEWILRAGDWWFLRMLSGFPEEMPNWIRQLQRPGRLTARLNCYRANIPVIAPKSLSRAPRVSVPVMGVFSGDDRFLAEAQMTASQKYVDAPWRYERVEGANHWLQITAPEKVNALLLDYLQSNVFARAGKEPGLEA